MRFKSFRIRPFLICLIAALVYPAAVLFTAEKKLLKCMDSLAVTGLVLIVLGIVLAMVRHGDFDVIEYVTQRGFRREKMKPFADFMADKKEKRKDSFNYPLLTGLMLLLISGILALVVY